MIWSYVKIIDYHHISGKINSKTIKHVLTGVLKLQKKTKKNNANTSFVHHLCYLCFDMCVCDVWKRKIKLNICLLDQTQPGQRQMQMLLLSEGLTILHDLGVGTIWIWLANKPAKLWLFLLWLSKDLIATQAQECKDMRVQLGLVFAPIWQVNLKFACLLRASSGSFPPLHISGLAAPERHLMKQKVNIVRSDLRICLTLYLIKFVKKHGR